MKCRFAVFGCLITAIDVICAFECPLGEDCTIYCDLNDNSTQCSSVNITCAPEYECHLTCVGWGACDNSHIIGNNASILNITSGSDSFKGTLVTCPANGQCFLNCAYFGCQYMSLVGNYAEYIDLQSISTWAYYRSNINTTTAKYLNIHDIHEDDFRHASIICPSRMITGYTDESGYTCSIHGSGI